jgi:hypothetical protein
MKTPISPDAVVVSDESFQDEEPASIVASNIDFVNSLLDGQFKAEELSANALRSYYVDYFLCQVENGGFSQFVYNSRWNPKVIELVHEGLSAINARLHLDVLEEGMNQVEELGEAGLEAYFASEYFGENEVRDDLNEPNDRFVEASKSEDLFVLNAAWLRQRPDLVVLTAEQIQEEIRRRKGAIPDLEQRLAEAKANEPRYMKLIRALCEKVGHELERVTAGDPTRIHDGQQTMAWHFITDKGHHHMVDLDGKAIMFLGHSTTDSVCEINAPEE